MSLPLILCLLAIVASIVIGYKFKFNTGVIALAFAFIIGNLVMGLKVNDIVAFWPTTIVFYLLSIALFFNYATENGTMDVLGKKLLYAMGGNSQNAPAQNAGNGAWNCACGKTGNTGKFCSECGKPRPDGAWFCTECGAKNTGKFCSECGKPRA